MKNCSLLFIVLLAGCATEDAGILRDGVRYGVTDGPFRARWWSYYERGKSYLDGGFYEEARRDFQQALRERNTDQRWARTYGLHFVPQYFPNRELGVALFHLGLHADAARALESSHAQDPSARAAYFLRLARRALAGTVDDPEAPVLELDAAVPSTPFNSAKTHLNFSVRDNTYVDTVEVDGEPVDFGPPADRVSINKEVILTPGVNLLHLKATDTSGNQKELDLELFSDMDGPLVSFENPLVLPGILRGIARDDSGIASIAIEGKEVTVRSNGELQEFSLELRREDLLPPISFTATDSLGNVSRGIVPTDVFQVAALPDGLCFAGGRSEVSLGSGLTAHYFGRQLFAVSRSDPTAVARVKLTNLADGQRYLLDEIVADIEVEAPTGIKALSLNGLPVPFFPDRLRQRTSRRIPLPNEGPVKIVAKIEEPDGTVHESVVSVERVLTTVEELDNKLSLAVLGNIWEGVQSDHKDEEKYLSDELTRLLYNGGRFQLVTREALPQVLSEQELAAAVGDRHGPSPLQGIVTADIMVVGMVRRDQESIEIILQALSLETSQLLGYADVAGKADSKEALSALIADLALRFTQDFPRIEGRVVDIRANTEIHAAMGTLDLIRPDMKCIVFRHGPEVIDPKNGTSLGAPTQIIAEGRFADVKQRMSTVSLLPAPLNSETVQVEDLVLTK